jgi:hypothetical protein
VVPYFFKLLNYVQDRYGSALFAILNSSQSLVILCQQQIINQLGLTPCH